MKREYIIHIIYLSSNEIGQSIKRFHLVVNILNGLETCVNYAAFCFNLGIYYKSHNTCI